MCADLCWDGGGGVNVLLDRGWDRGWVLFFGLGGDFEIVLVLIEDRVPTVVDRGIG